MRGWPAAGQNLGLATAWRLGLEQGGTSWQRWRPHASAAAEPWSGFHSSQGPKPGLARYSGQRRRPASDPSWRVCTWESSSPAHSCSFPPPDANRFVGYSLGAGPAKSLGVHAPFLWESACWPGKHVAPSAPPLCRRRRRQAGPGCADQPLLLLVSGRLQLPRSLSHHDSKPKSRAQDGAV